MLLLEKNKLNNIEALISRTLTDSYISHDEFVLVNDALREYDGMKKRNQKFKDFILHSFLATRQIIKYFNLFIKYCHCIV